MENLNRKIFSGNAAYPINKRKIKILQFGEGNFLRAFADWIIQTMNDSEAYNGGVAVVQPMLSGRVAELEKQDGLYTLYLEGVDNGQTLKKHRVIDVLNDFINPYERYDKFIQYARSEDLEIIISNTTEAGISLDASDTDLTKCPKSFPGKLLAFLYERYNYFKGDYKRGLGIIPCELIDNNGAELKRVLTELAVINKLGDSFIKWLSEANHFTNTLVDRIVPGYPKDNIAEIRAETGYIDTCVVKGEIFHLWVLENNDFIQRKFPADKCGLNVIFAKDIKPYKERKVKILNGAHTALVPIAYLNGFDTVRESVCDPVTGGFLRKLIFDEIKPTVKLPANETAAFAESVLERFQNPFIRHELMSIALNSTTKFRTRLLPTLIDYVGLYKKLPVNLCHAFAALILFHRGRRGNENIALNDNPAYLARWKKAWENFPDYTALVKEVSGWTDIWDTDLSRIHKGFVDLIAADLKELAERKV